MELHGDFFLNCNLNIKYVTKIVNGVRSQLYTHNQGAKKIIQDYKAEHMVSS